MRKNLGKILNKYTFDQLSILLGIVDIISVSFFMSEGTDIKQWAINISKHIDSPSAYFAVTMKHRLHLESFPKAK
jgi:hypothetical protein